MLRLSVNICSAHVCLEQSVASSLSINNNNDTFSQEFEMEVQMFMSALGTKKESLSSVKKKKTLQKYNV